MPRKTTKKVRMESKRPLMNDGAFRIYVKFCSYLVTVFYAIF